MRFIENNKTSKEELIRIYDDSIHANLNNSSTYKGFLSKENDNQWIKYDIRISNIKANSMKKFTGNKIMEHGSYIHYLLEGDMKQCFKEYTLDYDYEKNKFIGRELSEFLLNMQNFFGGVLFFPYNHNLYLLEQTYTYKYKDLIIKGTLDGLIADPNGNHYLIDWKTGLGTPNTKSWAVQLGGYFTLLRENNIPLNNPKAVIIRIDGVWEFEYQECIEAYEIALEKFMKKHFSVAPLQSFQDIATIDFAIEYLTNLKKEHINKYAEKIKIGGSINGEFGNILKQDKSVRKSYKIVNIDKLKEKLGTEFSLYIKEEETLIKEQVKFIKNKDKYISINYDKIKELISE